MPLLRRRGPLPGVRGLREILRQSRLRRALSTMSRAKIAERYRPFVERYPVLALIGGTRLFPVVVPEIPENHTEILAKAEWTNPGGSIKDRPVAPMLLEAILSGELVPGRD